MGKPVVHFEITGNNGKALQKFYGDLFDWKIDANNPMNYGMVDTEGGPAGINGGISDSPAGAQTMFYIGVDDPQAYLDKIEQAGGKTVMPVSDLGMVVIAQFADPEGNVIGLVKDQTET
jgi:predicted enzyme related to lactoylglutathione lyase